MVCLLLPLTCKAPCYPLLSQQILCSVFIPLGRLAPRSWVGPAKGSHHLYPSWLLMDQPGTTAQDTQPNITAPSTWSIMIWPLTEQITAFCGLGLDLVGRLLKNGFRLLPKDSPQTVLYPFQQWLSPAHQETMQVIFHQSCVTSIHGFQCLLRVHHADWCETTRDSLTKPLCTLPLPKPVHTKHPRVITGVAATSHNLHHHIFPSLGHTRSTALSLLQHHD